MVGQRTFLPLMISAFNWNRYFLVFKDNNGYRVRTIEELGPGLRTSEFRLLDERGLIHLILSQVTFVDVCYFHPESLMELLSKSLDITPNTDPDLLHQKLAPMLALLGNIHV